MEAELTDFSLSSGISIEDMRAFLADKRRRFWTGLEGAEKDKKENIGLSSKYHAYSIENSSKKCF